MKSKSAAMEMKHVAAMKKAGVPKKIVKEELAEAKAYGKAGKKAAPMKAMKKGGKC